jgi:peroxiredoxin Q/BCP
MLQAGHKLPSFSLQNQDGVTRTPQDYAGKWLVLYIYPKDDTPGCTIQGKSFTATKEEFDKANITVVGLSADDVASHKNFCNKFSLTVELLADPDTTLLQALDPGQTDYNGVKYWNRTSFVIDPHGVVRKVYEKVTPQDHEQALLKDINDLQKAAV